MTTNINSRGPEATGMSPPWRGFLQMTILAIASAALFWLLRDHWNHVLGYAPYLLFLACPLMHLFMHHGHGQHGHEAQDRRDADDGRTRQ